MLTTLLTPNVIQVVESATDWRDAIKSLANHSSKTTVFNNLMLMPSFIHMKRLVLTMY